jgi:putative transposase
MKESVRLRKVKNKFYIDIYFEKSAPDLKTEGKEIGLDCGYKKLLISSENTLYDTGLQPVYEKISRKKQGSNRFKKALIERDNKINESINLFNFNELKTIVVEDLKNVKKDSKGKINKSFNNKLQRWSYSKVLNRLELHCEEKCIDYRKVNPAYTSQTCSKCGFRHKDNRLKDRFQCLDCGYLADADFNASVNILHRGIYSSTTTKNVK